VAGVVPLEAHQDLSVYKKYAQLKSLGFTNVSIYMGGLFEWALLQEVYGTNFMTIGTLSEPLDVYKKIDLYLYKDY
jgi:hypothetical protein